MNLAEQTKIGTLTAEQQYALMHEIVSIERSYPFVRPSAAMTIDGRRRVMPMSVEVLNVGTWGWWSDSRGSRYVTHHPTTGQPWAVISKSMRGIAAAFDVHGVDSVHITRYLPGAQLRLHRDRDEGNPRGTILICSLGDSAVWAVEDAEGRVHETEVVCGDVVELSAAAGTRRLRHGIRRVDAQPSASLFSPNLLGYPGRISVSFRQGAAPR